MEIIEENISKNVKKKWTILGMPIDRLCVYFIIYSIIGFILETIFGLLSEGVIESRKSFLYGPFCAIYGLGAIVMLPVLNKLKENNSKLFIGGCILGTITEYLVSLIGEMVFHVKWWDYSELPFNIYGRVCLVFSLVWGILGVILVKFVNPRINEWIVDKIPQKHIKRIAVVGITVLFIDWIVSSIAVQIFFARLVTNYPIELKNESQYQIKNSSIYQSEIVQYLSKYEFTDEKIVKAFPNLKFEDKDGNIIFVRDVLTDINPYYLKIFEKNKK